MTFQDHIDFVIKAHQDKPKAPKNSTRYWDKTTPYAMHPLWCGMTILSETTLPDNIRQDGFQALLYHDVIEDTDADLPPGLSDQVISYIHEMTFAGGFEEELTALWDRSQEARLFRLYDKVSNLLDAAWMTDADRTKYNGHTLKLLADVENAYGHLNITKIAHSILG